MIAIALPMVISFACDTVMIMTDRLLLSRLGPEYMNATLGGGLAAFVLTTFMIGLTGYTTALTAQYVGAGRKERGPVVLTQAVILILIAYPVILMCRPLLHHVFDHIGADPRQIAPQKVYFDIVLSGCIFWMLRHAFSSFFSGQGTTRIVMTASLTAMAVNGVASYVLIYGKLGFPAMGIAGAATGSVVASVCGLLMLAGTYFGKKIRDEYRVLKSFVLDWDVMKQLLRFGTPAGLEMFLNVLAFNGMVMIFHSMGAVQATAATVVLNWDMVSYIPLMGLEIGVTSLVGRYMGARQPEVAHRAVMSGLKLGGVVSSVMLILFLFFPAALVEVYRPSAANGVFDAAVPAAVFMLRLTTLYLFSEVIVIVFTGALRGAGDTVWAMCYTVGLHWLICGALFVAVKVLGASAETGWMTLITIFLALSGAVWLRYRGGKWKTLRVVEGDDENASQNGTIHAGGVR